MAVPTRVPADTLGTPVGPLTRLWRLPLRFHLLGLVGLLLAVSAAVGTHGSFSADEGAAIAQARHLAEDGRWTVAHPFPDADPAGTAFPYDLSIRTDEGYAIFYKHPVYPAVLARLYGWAGVTGLVLLSVAGAIAAAALGAALAERIDPTLTRPTLWAVGVASPLLFDSQLVIAHTLGAALVAGATWLTLVALERRWVVLAAPVVLALGAAILLRNEAVLFAVALAAVLGGVALRRRDGLAGVLAAGAAGAAVAFPLADRWLAETWIGAAEALGTPTLADGGGVTGLAAARIDGFVTTVLMPTYVPGSLAGLLVCGIAVTAVAAALAIRRSPHEDGLVRLLVGIAVAAACVRLVVGVPSPVPGLLAAFPLLAVGVVLFRRSLLDRLSVTVPAATAVLFALGVLATQYAAGGSGEWGGRYFALAIPVVTPVALLAIRRAGAALHPETRRIALAGLVVVSLALAIVAVSTLRRGHDQVDDLVDHVATAAAGVEPGDGGTPVVLTTSRALPRLSWARIHEARWLLAQEDAVADLGQQVADAGPRHIVFVTDDPARDLPELDDRWAIEADPAPVPGSLLFLAVLERR